MDLKKIVFSVKMSFSHLKVFSEENIIEEILSATIAECVDETNVDRTSLLTETSFYLLVVMQNVPQHRRPAIIFSLRYSPNPIFSSNHPVYASEHR